MATAAPSASVGAVSGARAAYDIHSSNNQENQTSRKYGSSANSLRQRSTSNLRAPLSNVSSGRKGANEANKLGNHRNGDNGRTNDDGQLGSTEQYDDIPENMYRPDKEDRAGWIHREKLAKIENEELQAAGINLAKARSRNRDSSGTKARDTSRDRRDLGSGTREEKKLKMSPPVNEAPDENEAREEWDLRTPEEIASDASAAQIYSSPTLRKSGSKIPVMTSSPTPIPSDRYERETPMPRKRTLSGTITPEDNLAIIKAREGQDGDTSSKSNSPTKQRSKSFGNAQNVVGTPENKTTAGKRKGSVQIKSSQIPTTPDGRPVTRGNDTERPRTAVNPPEGDPPWLATMYKPDPMLPPDQQLIPTLAKKRQQEMWEATGQVPSTYDRNFTALQIYGADGQPSQTGVESSDLSEKADQTDAWPLKSLPSKPMTPTNRPPTSSGTGGYSTMPKVTSAPVVLAPSPKIEASSPANSRAHTPVGNQALSPQNAHGSIGIPSRLQQQPLTAEQEEKVEKKKGCCCIVM